MPTKYPKGSYIVRGEERRKVLEELGELRFFSWAEGGSSNWETLPSVMSPITVAGLERDGWKAEEDAKAPEPWKPEDGAVVFYVTEIGSADGFKFCSKDGFGVEYIQVGNLYRTREEAEKAAERVRKAYKE